MVTPAPQADDVGCDASNQGRIITFPGGAPVTADGAVAGAAVAAIGVSGGKAGQDQQVAEAEAAAFRLQDR